MQTICLILADILSTKLGQKSLINADKAKSTVIKINNSSNFSNGLLQ